VDDVANHANPWRAALFRGFIGGAHSSLVRHRGIVDSHKANLRERSMETLVGIFNSRRQAEEALNGLHAIGLSQDSLIFLTPQNPEEVQAVPTTDAEEPGIGRAISGYVGGVIGGSVGFGVGSAAASLLVPGVGPVLAAGLGAAALLGLGGAAVGASIGDATEKALDQGVPRDEILFFRELLKRGRSLVIAAVEREEMLIAARVVLEKHNAEDVDMARQLWEATRSGEAA
jgi:hypothetical protein